MSAPGRGRWLLIAAGVAVVLAVVGAITVIGTPAQQRMLREDERRVDDLVDVQRDINAWARQREALPPDLATLANRPGVSLSTRDPFTGEAYAYETLGEDRYRLCATFVTDTAEREGNRWQSEWRHARGRQCFERRVSKRGQD